MERITGAIREVYARVKEQARQVVRLKYGLAIAWEPPGDLMERMGRYKRYNREDMMAVEMADVLGVKESTYQWY